MGIGTVIGDGVDAASSVASSGLDQTTTIIIIVVIVAVLIIAVLAWYSSKDRRKGGGGGGTYTQQAIHDENRMGYGWDDDGFHLAESAQPMAQLESGINNGDGRLKNFALRPYQPLPTVPLLGPEDTTGDRIQQPSPTLPPMVSPRELPRVEEESQQPRRVDHVRRGTA